MKTTVVNLDSKCEVQQKALVSILTIEEKAGILDAQPVGGHTGIVPIILFSDIGNHQNCSSAKNLDVDALGIGQPGDDRQAEGREIQILYNNTKEEKKAEGSQENKIQEKLKRT